MNPLQETVQKALSVPGITQEGGAWLAKALHPSDATLPVSGIPTMEAEPTAALNFMTTATIVAPGSATWNADILLAPTPVSFAKAHTTDTSSAYGVSTFYNGQLGVTSAFSEFGANARTWNAAAHTAWGSNTLRYRLTYAALTATLSANATADQGTLTAAQYSLKSSDLAEVQVMDLTTSPATGNVYRAEAYENQPQYTQNQLQGVPGSVTWEAKKGAYMVLKLDGDLDSWVNSYDPKSTFSLSSMSAPTSPPKPSTATDFSAASAAAVTMPPFGPTGAWGGASTTGTGATSVFNATTSAQYRPSSKNIGHLTFVGLDPSATISLTLRVGFEALVQPSSIYIGQVGAPVPHDAVALDAYFRVAREMLAAYPAEYNFLGTLFNVVKGIGSRVLPALGGAVKSIFSGPTTVPTVLPPPRAEPVAVTPPVRAPAPQVVYVNAPPQRKKTKKGKAKSQRATNKGRRRSSRR